MTITRVHPSHFGPKGMPKPGLFKATCRLNQPVLFDDLTTEQRDLVEELKRNGYHSRKLKGTVVDVPCRFETTDRAEFDAHMKNVHGRTIGRKVWSDSGLPPLTKPGWKAPKLTEQGVPWPEIDERTLTCPCGLVAEVARYMHSLGQHADEQWWNEHVSFCTKRGAA